MLGLACPRTRLLLFLTGAEQLFTAKKNKHLCTVVHMTRFIRRQFIRKSRGGLSANKKEEKMNRLIMAVTATCCK